MRGLLVGLLLTAGYVVGWFIAAVRVARVLSGTPRCRGRLLPFNSHYLCYGTESDGDPFSRCSMPRERRFIDAPLGALAGLAWPLLLMFAAVWISSAPPPRPDYEAIARLERELGIGDGGVR